MPLLLSLWPVIGAAQANGTGNTATPGGADGGVNIDCGSGDGCTQCNKPTSATYKADPVWTYDGSLQLRYTYLALGQNFSIVIDCKYNSRSPFGSAVGYGWAFAHDRRLFE